jgi:hypothetical protein
MTKLYPLILAILFSSITFAQNGANKGFENLKSQLSSYSDINKVITSQPLQNKKAVGDTIWSEDFTNGFPAGWSVYDSTGNNYNWVINNGDIENITANPSGYTNATGIASSSGGNYILLFGDEYNRVQLANTGTSVEMNAYFQTSAIPINGQPGINVIFQQKQRRCCANSGLITVLMASTDPTFTTNVQSYDILGGIATSQQTPDPMDMSINISDIAGGINGNLYLRFYIGAGISHYYWMIDDIHIVESPVNDIEVSNGFYGFDGYQYTRIPVSQIEPIDFSIQSENKGSANQTGTNFTVDINNGTSSIFNGSSNDTTINSLSTDTFDLNDFWTPPFSPLNQPYTVSLDVFSDSLDETPQNNSIIFPSFEVTSAIMALDDYSVTPGNGGGNAGPNGVSEYEVGNQFYIVNQDEDLYAIDIVTGSNTPVNTSIDAFIYEVDFSTSPETYIEIWRSQGYAITSADVGDVHHFNDIPGTAIATLTNGKTYFAGAHSYFDYEFATSGTNPISGTPSERHSAIRYPNMVSPNPSSSYGLTNTPMIRLNFDMTVGIDNIIEATNFILSPNPTSGKFTITIDSEEINNLSITNTVGQEILSKTINSIGKIEEEISLEGYDKGIYFITLTNKKESQTSKLILE